MFKWVRRLWAPDDPEKAADRIVMVADFSNPVEAHMAADALGEADIQCSLHSASFQMPRHTVWVFARDLDRARGVMRELHHDMHGDPRADAE